MLILPNPAPTDNEWFTSGSVQHGVIPVAQIKSIAATHRVQEINDTLL